MTMVDDDRGWVAAPAVPAPASWGARAAAVVVDSMLLGLVAWWAVPSGTAPGLWPGLPAGGTADDGVVPAWSPAMLVCVLALLALQAWSGATVGKRALGIVVVDADTGRPVGVLRTSWRQLLHVLDSLLLIGYLRPLWDAQGRTFADSLARTRVLRTPWPPGWASVPAPVGRWARPVAVALALVAVAGGLVTSDSAQTRTVDGACRTADAPDGVTTHLAAQVTTRRQARLGLTREGPPAADRWDVSWELPAGTTDGRQVRVDTTVSGPATSGSASVWSSSQDEGTGVSVAVGTVEAPDAVGSGRFTVDSTVLVDGVELASCHGTVDVDDAGTRP